MTLHENVEQASENSYLKFFSRLAMVTMLPVLGWLWTQSYATFQAIEESERKDRLDVALLAQTVNTNIQNSAAFQADVNTRFSNLFRRLDTNPYSNLDAQKDFAFRDLAIKDLQDRVRRLEHMNSPDRSDGRQDGH